jgi:hypothetical protein
MAQGRYYNSELVKDVYVVNPVTTAITASGTTTNDAFNRLRVSDPFTLFDSSHRYVDNGEWVESTAVGGSTTFDSDAGLLDLTVTTASGSQVLRETKKVFNYQPGKSLLTILSFNFEEAQSNLRQRIGYFGSENGFYLELNGTSAPSFVKRSSVTGSLVNTEVSQSSWNVDRLDGPRFKSFGLILNGLVLEQCDAALSLMVYIFIVIHFIMQM